MLCLFATFALAAADGTPVDVPLRYVPGISNWGPTTASGQAEIVEVEGEVRVTTSGLPPLTTDLYQAWLVNTKTGDRLSLGKFNADSANQGEIDTIVDLSGRVFDLVVITVQPEPDPSTLPDARLSLAGFFPTTGAPTATAASVVTPVPLPTLPGGKAPTATPGSRAAGSTVASPVPVALTPLPAIPLKLPSTGGFPPAWFALGAGVLLVAAGTKARRARRRR